MIADEKSFYKNFLFIEESGGRTSFLTAGRGV